MDKATTMVFSALIFTHPDKPTLIQSLTVGAMRCAQEGDKKGAQAIKELIDVAHHYMEDGSR